MIHAPNADARDNRHQLGPQADLQGSPPAAATFHDTVRISPSLSTPPSRRTLCGVAMQGSVRRAMLAVVACALSTLPVATRLPSGAITSPINGITFSAAAAAEPQATFTAAVGNAAEAVARNSGSADPDLADFIPQPGRFPPAGAGVELAGELVIADPIRRKGALRLDGDGVEDRYHHAPPHHFVLLPYGQVRYHGSAAELRDVPLQTRLHGRFCLPPAGDQSVPVPPASGRQYVPPHNQALALEDDFSYHSSRGQAWKIVLVKPPTHPQEPGQLRAQLTGPDLTAEQSQVQTFDLGETTRVWRNREIGQLDDLVEGAVVQFNFTWAADWVNGRLFVSDVWLDETSRQLAAETQRQQHLRYERIRGIPGWIEHVEYQSPGRGLVTVTLFAGRDDSLTEGFQKGGWIRMAAAEPSLRTWWQEHDYKGVDIVARETIENPAFGSSGIQLQLQCHELLEGFRPGRIVRLCNGGWPRIKLPPEERVKDLSDR